MNPNREATGIIHSVTSLSMGNHTWLVVEPYPSEKYELVSWDYEIPN